MIVNVHQVEKRLAARLEAGLDAWNKCLMNKEDDDRSKLHEDDTDAPQKPVHKLGGEPNIKVRQISYLPFYTLKNLLQFEHRHFCFNFISAWDYLNNYHELTMYS